MAHVSSIAKLWPQFYPYQVDGVTALYQSGGRLILADDVGLGKTPQALAALKLLNVERSLVVAPASVLYKWQDEFSRWLRWSSTVIASRADPLPVMPAHLITTYNLLTDRYDEFARLSLEALVLDECHKAKNPQAQRTRAAMRLSRRVPHLLFLSGTPFLNRREELWPLLNMLDPGVFRYLGQFREAYCNDYRGSAHWTVKDPVDLKAKVAETAARNRAALAQALQPYFLRRTQGEVGSQIPPMTRQKVRVPLTGRLAREYKLASRDLLTWLKVNGLPARKAAHAEALVKLGYLRRLVGQAKIEPSLELARDVLDGDPAQKVVLYAQHGDVVHALWAGLQAYSPLVIDGSTPTPLRAEYQRTFQTVDAARAIIITEAGEEGIDLYRARTIIHAEQGWTPKSRIQAEGRVHRTGQVWPVVSIIPIVAGTLDPMLDALIERKQADFEAVAGADAVETVTRELLRELLEGA